MLRWISHLGWLGVLVLLCSAPAWTDQRELEAYGKAVNQTDVAARIRATEMFLGDMPETRLKPEALQILIWDCIQTNQSAKAQTYARQVLDIEATNALALAVASDIVPGSDKKAKEARKQSFENATKGIESYARLRRPTGMNEADFSLMRRYVVATLSGQAGLGYLDQRDYKTAREYLRQAVVGSPNDGRYVYGLALALLNGKNPDAAEGYRQLARAVNLSKGTPAGDQIAEYAWRSYEEAGGTRTDWQQFLAAGVRETRPAQGERTAVAAVKQDVQPQQGDSRATEQASRTTEADSEQKSDGKKEVAKVVAPEQRQVTPKQTASLKQPPSPALIPPPRFQRHREPQDAPLSLGILVQTSKLTEENRRVLATALIDMVRRLRAQDEAFIIAYSDRLDFEEDLTANEKLLEDAIDRLQPAPGAALFDAVEFAAGHLERIARNKNRVLLLISDGSNTKEPSSTRPFTSELSNVRVNCIGMDAFETQGRNTLIELASYSGGVATFAAGPDQLRAATQQIAKTMGIGFPN